jgi:hypothetical protein
MNGDKLQLHITRHPGKSNKTGGKAHISRYHKRNEKKMRTAGILILFFSFTLFASGQEQLSVPLLDTSVNKMRNSNSVYLFGTPSLSLPLSLRIIPENIPYYLNQPSIVSLQYSSWKLQQNLSLAPIWKLELAKQEEYKTLRTILGSIEAGGVAYLTYLHFKKYGIK